MKLKTSNIHEHFHNVFGEPAPTIPNCIRCGEELTAEICGSEYIDTGICANCWTPEDKEDSA